MDLCSHKTSVTMYNMVESNISSTMCTCVRMYIAQEQMRSCVCMCVCVCVCVCVIGCRACTNGHCDSCCCTLSLHSRMYSIVRLKSHTLRASNLKSCNLHYDWCNYCHTRACWAYKPPMGLHNHTCNTVISLHFMALKSNEYI